MDTDPCRTLTKVLGKREIEKIPPDILKKIEKFCEEKREEFTTTKVLYNTAQKNIEKLRKDFEKQSSKAQDTEVKTNAAQANVAELRNQLDKANSEIERLTNQVTQHESETVSYRKERNDIMDERDQLQNSLDRNNATLQRLQSDIKNLEKKLETVVSEKSIALADLADMVTKEQSLDYKEKRLEREKERLNNEILILTEKLKDSTTELVALRQGNRSDTGQFEAELKQKTEDLLNANATILQLTETNRQLTNQSEQNNLKLKEQVDESVRLVDHYRKELDAKIRLADLYKESNDDCQVQVGKQATAIEDLKRQLDESTNQCRTLEGKLNDVEARHQIDMATKDEMIENLKQELKMFETDTPETILEKLAPSAAAANRLLKGNLSLTEIYTRYYNAIDNVNSKDYECMKLKMELQRVQSELNEKTPEYERQKVEYKKMLTTNEDLTQKVNNFMVEQDRHQEELKEIQTKFGCLERENAKLKSTQKDLARQICYLLNEIQASGSGVTPDQEQSKPSSIATNPAIAKKLVTFKDIEEMQENNQKLLVKVRELSAKVEELEEIQNHIKMQCYDAKISSYEKQLRDAEKLQRADKELLAICLKQKERFKQLYYDAMKDFCKTPPSGIEGIEDDTTVMNDPNILKNVQIDGQNKRASEIEKMLQNKIKELKDLKEEYNDYRTENSGNFKLLNDQFEAMQNKVKELISANCQLSTQVNFANEKVKNQEDEIIVYKKQIQVLEERNQMYDKIIGKHELSIKHLRDEALNAMKKLSAAENQCGYLQEECRRLIDSNSNLTREQQAFRRQNLTHNILQSNLEMMKVSSERLQFEGRVQMEQQLDKITRECSTLRQKLKEEQNRFREDATTFKRQADSAVKKMKDEQAQAEMLRSKIKEERKQIELKNQQINDLSKKLQEALTPCKFDNPIAKGNKKIKDLELQMKNKAAEIEKLKNDLKTSITKATQLSKQVAVWENKSKVESDKFETSKAKLMSDLQASQLNETNLKSQVEELQSEIRLQITGSHLKAADAVAHSKVQNELKEALQKNAENNRELRDLRAECHKLKMSFETIELKYSNEMQLHSSDLQVLTSCKDELNKCREQIDQLRCARDEATEKLKTSQLEIKLINKQANDNQLEFEERLANLTDQNTALHDLLQTHNTKATSSNSDVMNDSIADSSILSCTLTDDKINEISSEKLFSVIKYLRREKDISVAKIEILKTENTRLLNEYELQQKHLNELIEQRTADKSPANEANVVSASKYDDLMRKVETLNAITDSNIRLRNERDALVINVRELTERMKKIEDELFPLQEKNRELSAKAEEQTQINNMLRTNLDNWRKRASEMAEQSNKNPEDFKRLQNERENLAKMLTAEKDNIRQLNEEVSSLKIEKTRLELDLATTNKKLHTTIDEKKKVQDELNNLKRTNMRLTQEAIELKNIILKKEGEYKNELSSKDAQLLDSKNKEVQIRRIAKKYKDSFTDLKTKEDEREASKSTGEQKTSALTVRAGVEAGESSKLEDLLSQLASCREEIEQLRNEKDNWKKQELMKLITEGNDAGDTASKSQLEAKVKDLLDQEFTKQETIARLTRENETLNARFNQLHRQQGSKPSTSSGAIEKSPSDLARTANVKPMATPNAQSATGNLRRGGDTPLASIRPMSVQNSRTAAVLPTSQTSNIASVQGSSSGSVTTALVPPQQQVVHTTGNLSTAEAMSSSPTSSHTDYMPATSSAVVIAVPPMASASASAESTQEAESLSVNTNESSSTSSTQAVLQQAVALVSPRVEVTAQNVLASSQQVVDVNQAASTSGSSSSFLTTMSSHHQASSSNTVTTTQAGSHKRPRDAAGDCSTGKEESAPSEKTSPQNKRIRVGEQTFQGVTESGLDVEYQVPTSSQRDQEDDAVAIDSEEDDDGMDDEATADVDEAFDAEIGDTDEIESFGQVEGHDIDEDNVPDDTNEVEVDDSSDAPNQSSNAASSGARENLAEAIEASPLSQETQQIQMISSGSDAGPSGLGGKNTWRQVQPSTASTRQQQNLVIQQVYEETGDDSIVPSTPTLYVARRADGFSEAVRSPHPNVHHTRFTFNESSANRAVLTTLRNTTEGMDDTRMDLNLLDESGDGGQSSSINAPAHDSDNQEIVTVDLVNENSSENKEVDRKEQIAGVSGQGEGSTSQIMVTDAVNERNTFDNGASTSHVSEDQNVSIEVGAENVEEVGTDGVSSEGEVPPGRDGIQVEEGREAEASPVQNRNRRTSRRNFRGVRGMALDNQRPAPIIWDQVGRYHPMSPHHQHPHRDSHNNRGQLMRGNRGRPRRPYR